MFVFASPLKHTNNFIKAPHRLNILLTLELWCIFTYKTEVFSTFIAKMLHESKKGQKKQKALCNKTKSETNHIFIRFINVTEIFNNAKRSLWDVEM